MTATNPASRASARDDRRAALALFLAALVLGLAGLGIEPLRDWDEGTVARVAQEIREGGPLRALFPSLWGEPYLNKPPLVHALIALAFAMLGESSLAARLVPAVLSATIAPLLWLMARGAGMARGPAMLAALIALTLLPLMRHGRLAMLDGAVVAFGLAMFVALQRAGPGRAGPALAAGLAVSAMALTKGLLALPFVAIALGMMASGRLARPGDGRGWAALALGLVPAFGWLAAQVWHYGPAWAGVALVDQGFARVHTSVEGNAGPVWYYLAEILKYGWPWLAFLPAGVMVAWRTRHQADWALLALVWAGGFVLLVSLMPTKLPWYLHPAWPPLALLMGAGLHASLAQGGLAGRLILPVLGLAGLGAMGLFSPLGPDPVPMLVVAGGVLALGAGLARVLWRRDGRRAVAVLVGAVWLALLLFALSGRSVWELNEDFPVLPVAEAIRAQVPAEAALYTTHPYRRPSLDFYAGRPVLPRPVEALQALAYQPRASYWLADPGQFAAIPAALLEPVAAPGGLWLVRLGGLAGAEDATGPGGATGPGRAP